MSRLPDAVVASLRDAAARPDIEGGRYEVLERIGEGGMGTVWRARDRLLERDVAIKVLAPHLGGAEAAERLRREARILARLEHPGIVPVHDTGALEDGRAWYAMKLVRGAPLDPRAAGSVGDLLRTVIRVAETVSYAHAHGVLHRDLKPGNVMTGGFGEVLVMDWGVAKVAGAHEPSAVLGTPGFMAPEQAGDASRAEERSDVFGLGALLGALLDARPEPVPPRLAAIRRKAMAAFPGARYASAEAFAADLRGYLDGGPVAAYREGFLERIGRFAHRHRTAILLVVAYLVMRVVILIWRGI
jgi:serine/threonine protein kinase